MVKKMMMTVLSMVMFGLVMTSCDGEKPNNGREINPSDGIPTVIKENMTLKEGQTYTLSNKVEVKKGAALTIPAGVTIKVKKGFANYILVEQGGKIFINGTADKPVKMTADIAGANAGHWGGLIINGYAPITNGGTNKTEIDPSKPYGGDNIADNSGKITYLILEYTGAQNNDNVEHNGLTLNAVGNGTTIENVFVRYGADDAIEFFGGSVNVTNFLAVNADDDMFDFTEGYCGTLINAYGVWEDGQISTEKDPRGVEADGNHDGNSPDGKPQSIFKIKNMTIELKMSPSSQKGLYMDDVIKVRRGATATIENALVKGQGQAKDLIDMTDGSGFGTVASKISITNNLSTPVSGKQIVNSYDHKDKDGKVVRTETYEYPNVKVVAGNTGSPTNIFSWTGYKF